MPAIETTAVKKLPKGTLNLLELKPERCHDWERDLATKCAVIKIPKFSGKILGKLLQPRLKQPFFLVHLDDFGTTVWECCDGNTTVAQMANTLRERFGDKVEPLTDRLSLFVKQLEEKQLVRITNLRELKKSR